MKIRKVLDKRVGTTSYFKYLITLPKEIVEDSRLLEKDLKVKLENNKICIGEMKTIKLEPNRQEMVKRELLKILEKNNIK